MKKLKGIIIGVVLFGAILGGIVFWQANMKVEDPADTKSEATFRQDELMDMAEEALEPMTDKSVSITGIVWANEGNETERTITLGVNELNSIICQIDNRHLETASKLVKGHFVKIKGKLTGHDYDDMLGKTIQMKNCVLTQ